jgi:hypothetical protein
MTAIFSSCNDDKPFFIKKVKIKGKINKSKNASGLETRSTDNPYSLDEATKVLIFYGRDYEIVNIKSDGTFSARAPYGTATALAFLTEDNKFIGNFFSGSLHFLPLVSNSGDLSDIDLDELTLDGYKVVPVNDPIQNQISLSEDEINYMQQLGSYYEALSRNLDMDNDGNLDILHHGKIDITFGTSAPGGKWGLNTTQTPVVEALEVSDLSATIFIEGPVEWLSSNDNSLPSNAWLTGPADDPQGGLNIEGDGYSNQSNFKVSFEASHGESVLSFPAGIYTLHIDNKEFMFNYSFVNSSNYRVIPVPTLITNAQNQVTNIRFTYQLIDGTQVDPRMLMASGIDFNICDQQGNFLLQGLTSNYSSIDFDYDYYNVQLEEPVNYSSIGSIGFRYIDIFGNSIGNGWHP